MTAPTDEQRRLLEEWLADRPPVIQDLARRFPPWGWFKMKSDSAGLWAYTPRAYDESGTLRMAKVSIATGEGIVQVFGISPDDLEPCGSPDEERERMSADDWAAGATLAGMHRRVLDHRLKVLDENPDAPPTTPDQALADYLSEELDSAQWVLTKDGKEVLRGEGLKVNADGSFTLEGTRPEE